jgi:hypothetical protein
MPHCRVCVLDKHRQLVSVTRAASRRALRSGRLSLLSSPREPDKLFSIICRPLGVAEAMVAVQELDAEIALEPGDALRDCRLGRVQPLRRAAEAAGLHHPEEGEFLKPATTISPAKYAWARSSASASIDAIGVIACFQALSIMFS